MKYISVRDIQRKIQELSNDLRRCKNAKVKARLTEEQAAYTITLRNFEHIRGRLEKPERPAKPAQGFCGTKYDPNKVSGDKVSGLLKDGS